MTLAPGTQIGSYAVVSLLGAGGMGEVYLARDRTLNRDVALKVLPASVTDDPDRLARFRREAQVLASLNHPNVAAVYGFEDTGAVHALVLEYVPGATVADRIAAGPIPIPDAVAIARQIAEALEAAHDAGIVHRDLKPANVKVREDGAVKVLDFGLAKAVDPASSGATQVEAMNSPTLTARATQLGVILGTAAYMSPEQAKGKRVDKRADIWAFGVVFYEMLTGDRVFKGDDISDTLASVLRDTPAFGALPATTPPSVRRLIERCLDRDPRTRLRDIGEARVVLTAVERGDADPLASAASAAGRAEPTTPGRSTRTPWIVAAASLIVAIGAVAWMALHAPAPPPSAPVTRSQFEIKDVAGFVALTHDGSRLAYTTVAGPANLMLALRATNQFNAVPIPGTDGGLWPIFSPDGQWIAYGTLDGKVLKIPVSGGTPVPICDGSFVLGAAWLDDDAIVFGGGAGLMRVPAGGGTPVAITKVDRAQKETAHGRPQMLPDGRHLLFSIVKGGAYDSASAAVLDLRKGTWQVVAPAGVNTRYVPTGHLTFMRGTTLFAVPFDADRLAVTGSEVPIVENVSTYGSDGTGDYAFSDNGLLVYAINAQGQGTTLAMSDRTGKVTPLAGHATARWGTGRLSPDGRRVANAIHNDAGGDIWVVELERGTATRLTFAGANDLPVWTPDGQRLVFSSQHDNKTAIAIVRADGSSRADDLAQTPRLATPLSVSPDGRTLLFAEGGDDRQQHLWVVPLAGGTPAPWNPTAGGQPRGVFSPDGRWVAYESSESGLPEVYLAPFPGPGAKTRVSTNGGSDPRWAHDGRALYYWSASVGARQMMAVDVQTTAGDVRLAAPRALFELASGTTWDVAPDGTFLVELARLGGSVTTFAMVTNWFDELRHHVPAKK